MSVHGKFVALLLALAPVAQAQEIEREWPAQVALDVDPAGQVVAAKLPADIPDALVKAANEVMSRWRFKPVQRDGHAVSAKTYARVKLQAVKRGTGTFGLQVVYLSNGPRLYPTVAPYYPLRESNHSEGALLIEAVVQTDGRIDDIKVVESHFSGGPRQSLFSKSAVEAVSRWHADPEYVDGHPVATHIQLPMTFCLSRDGCREPIPELKLQRKPAATSASLPLALGESIALDSPLEATSIKAGG